MTVRARKDHALETRMAGKFLKPGQEYWYRCETRTGSSPIGRFQTTARTIGRFQVASGTQRVNVV